MSQQYSDPSRAADPYSLPNVEVWYASEGDCWEADDDSAASPAGWYWQACFPGCLPDGEPMGPFETEAEAIADAQDTDIDEDFQ